ncbi:ABC transporter ATP-binding protein [Granulosicoccus sp. 3-233]|uniref:ABC transporter ATP-binding protein n=1 Tax=Granulosicoccus sp. 3-233 TaxID=3417969 RepID=UPI003D337EAE
MPTEPLLAIEGLSVTLRHAAVVRDLSLRLDAGDMLGLVGESGCGKSVTALSVLDLLEDSPLTISAGAVRFQGQDLRALDAPALQRLRGNRIAMIFQEPMTSLNPVFRIGDQIAEVLQIHRGSTRQQGRQAAVALLERVGMASPESMIRRYPHQLSGGQRQRVMIAMALACEPQLLIADEPTTALDVTVQAQILELLDQLRRDTGMAVLLITHDLGLVRQYCDQVAVMYCGQLVEVGSCDAVFERPAHRYTNALLQSVPALNSPGSRLPAIEGRVPAPGHWPPGCAYEPRCAYAIKDCAQRMPELESGNRTVRCWNPAS